MISVHLSANKVTATPERRIVILSVSKVCLSSAKNICNCDKFINKNLTPDKVLNILTYRSSNLI